MVTTSSTWTFEASGSLLGCGVDAEKVERFRADGSPDGEPWRLIFTEGEVQHCRTLPDPALGLCAAFCAKEATLKSVGVAIDYRSCELLFLPEREEQDLHLSSEFCAEHGISGAVARVVLNDEPRECVVTVCLFGCD
jgi:phosphopantetheinyl transferase (holo-ACP synthase)